jgi:hypothetical protein
MLRNVYKIVGVAALASVLLSCNHNYGIKRIWAVDDSEKIRRDDVDNLLANDENNAVWKNNSVNLFGGRNEIVAFQLIIEADTSGAKEVNVVISDLKNGTSVIPGSEAGPEDPLDYRGRYIELFTENYFNIEKRSPPLWFYSENAHPSDYYKGWVPDCLIPFSAPRGKGGAPFSIGPNHNQAVWVDIWIPRDANPGEYSGKMTLTSSGRIYKQVPVNLRVYNFTLSDSTHIENMFGLSPAYLVSRHGVVNGSDDYYNLEAKYHQMAHRHRFDLARSVANLTEMTKYHKRYLTGDLYTPAYGYAGPGENIGNRTFSIGFGGYGGTTGGVPDEYGGSIEGWSKSKWWSGSDAWEKWFLDNAPGVKRHRYLLPDEPDWKGPTRAKGTGSMDTIKMQAIWTHTNPGPGSNIPTFVTNTIRPVIQGHVDFWSVSSKEATENVSAEDIASEKSKGHRYGIYNGYRPGMGTVLTDADAVDFRVMPWIIWKYNLDQYFYWSANLWRKINVFTNPLSYQNKVNGDGTFLYPGQDVLYPEESRGIAGPLSSIRAKNWRRGAQDYEYLWLAKQRGLDNEARSIVDKCVPAALWDAKDLTETSWSSRGFKFELYRKQLAELLSGSME